MTPRWRLYLECLLYRGNAGEKILFVFSVGIFCLTLGYFLGTRNSGVPPPLPENPLFTQSLKGPESENSSDIFRKETRSRKPAAAKKPKPIPIEEENEEAMEDDEPETETETETKPIRHSENKHRRYQVIAGVFPGYKKSKALLAKLKSACPKAWILENKAPELSYSIMCSIHTSEGEAQRKLQSLRVANGKVVEID